MSNETSTKQPGKIARLFQLWEEAADGGLLPRAFAVDMAVAEGVNKWTARTQYQIYFNRAHGCKMAEAMNID